MEFPEALNEIVRAVVTDNPRSPVEDQVKEAMLEWLECEERTQDWIDMLERHAVQQIVWDRRHAINTSEKRALGAFGGPSKVGLGEGEVVRIAGETLLETLTICGVVLGDITGKQLHEFASAERNRAAGYLLNASFCEALQPLVGEEKTVRQCVKAKKVDAIWKRVLSQESFRKTRPGDEGLSMAGH